ncbi:putative Ig domain-containing protein, partial [Cellvibrio sp. pealriver]|uniref:putative Ig domain-containing protein n=1 Tax=Cellvibrio sp. pealriver TaxID=1622269 RepID=UPI0018CDED66
MSKLPRHRRPLIEALEPRLLFSATADIAVFDDGNSDAQYLAQAAEQVDLASIYLQDQPLMMASQNDTSDVAPFDQPSESEPGITSVVFVDTAVSDYEAIVDDIKSRSDADKIAVVYLDPQTDGVEQIASALAQYSNLSSIHIISHGSAGAVELGNTRLTDSTLFRYEDDLAAWGKALGEAGDILLYGCDVAAYPTGQALIERMAQLTDADVAASDDTTGHKTLGGDWDLEYRSGEIDSALLVSAAAQEQWVNAMATSNWINIQGGTNAQAVSSTTGVGQSFLYDSPGATYLVNQLSVQLRLEPGAANQDITIQLLDGGWNDATPLASQTFNSNALDGTFGWYTVNFGNVSLNDSQTYIVKITTNNADGKVSVAYRSDAWNNSEMIVNGTGNSANDLNILVSYNDGNNQAPVNTVPGAQSTNQNTPLIFSNLYGNRIQIADADAFPNDVEVTLTSGQGSLTLGQTTGLKFTSNDGFEDYHMVFRGSVSEVNAALATITYTPSNGFTGGDTISITTKDLGLGGGLQDQDNISISVNNTNDAPTATITEASYSVNEQVLLDLHGTGIFVNDSDGDSLTITISAPLALSELTAALGTTGVVISSGNGTNSLVLTGTSTQLNNLFIGNNGGTLTYRYSGDAPPATETLTISASDGSLSANDSATINITGVNDAPTVANPIADQSVTEGSALNFPIPGNTFSDPEGGALTYSAILVGGAPLPAWLQLDSVTGVFSGVPDDGDVGTLNIRVTAMDAGGLSVTDDFTLTVDPLDEAPFVLNPIADQAAFGFTAFSYQFPAFNEASPIFADPDVGGSVVSYRATLADGSPLSTTGWLSFDSATRTFSGTPTNADAGTITIRLYATDNTGLESATPDEFNIVVSATVNDAPVNTVPGAQSTNEDTALVFTGATQIQIADPDALSSDVQVTLSVSNGVLTLGGTANLTFFTGDGTSDTTMVFRGSVANINTALASLTYTPDAHFNGADTLSIVTNDLGNSGTGGAQSDTDTVNITVNSVNDAPDGSDDTIVINEDGSHTFTAADFGFSDANDSPANSLLAVQITTIPAVGSLTLSGVAVTAGQTVAVADINSGLLVYTPAANANGASYSSFTFQVQDNGGTANGGVNLDPVANTITFDVTAANDAPTLTITPTDYYANEQQTINLQGTGISVADVDGDPLTITVSATGAGSELTASVGTTGVVISSGNGTNSLVLTGTAAQLNNLLAGNNGGTLTYRMADDAPPATSTLTITASDGSLSGNDTATINITAANDAPVNTVPGAQSTNEDTALVFTGATQIQIADPDAGGGTLEVTLSVTNGTLTLGGTGGLAFTTGSGTADTTMVFTGTLADINTALNNLTFNPTANFNGGAVLSITTSDQGNSGSGGTLTDTDTVNITVNAVNDAPDGSDDTILINEDGSHTFTAADFGFSDANDAPANSLLAVRITTLPAVGSLTLSGVAVTAGQTVAVADINSGLLVYTPAANANGASYSSFTFQVQDNGGTANGGVNLDPVANTITFDVTAANDAPVNTVPGAQSTNEDTALVFTGATQIQIADPDVGGGTLEVTLSVTNGTLTLGGTGGLAFTTGSGAADTTMVFTGTLADINTALNNLTFNPTANFHGAAVLTITTSDQGNSGSGGTLTDTDTVNITVNAINDAPSVVITPTDYYADEQTWIDLHGTGISVADVDSSALTITITGAGSNSNLAATVGTTGVNIVSGINTDTLILSGTAAQLNDLFAGNNGGTLTYRLSGDTPVATRLLTVSASDGSLSSDDTATINITAVNDAPENDVPGAQVTSEDTALVFSSGNGNRIQVDDLDVGGGNLEITLSVTNGTLTLAGTSGLSFTTGDGTADSTLVFTGTKSDINTALATLTFNPTSNYSGAAVLSLTTSDLGNTGSGGTLTDTDTVNITVNSANDAPDGSDDTIVINEDGSHIFTAADFGFSDANDSPANSLLAVRITTLPAVGSLTLSGVAVTAGQTVAAADINSGLLVYTPAANANGAGYSSFTFQVQDNGGTANGGVNLDPVANTITFDVTAANDAPVNTVPGAQSTNEDTALVFTGATQIQIADPDAGGGTLEVTLSVTNGTLTLGGTGGLAFTTGDGTADTTMVFTGTLADINTALNNLTFNPTANFNGGAVLSITTSDQGNTGSGGTLTDTDTVNITVNAANDAPTVANIIPDQNATEDAAFNFQFASNTFADAELDSLTYSAQLNGGGGLPAWLSFDSATRTFSGTPANGDVGTLTIDVTANDGNGGTVTDTFTLTVANVNDAPTVANIIPDQNATEDVAFNFQFAANTFADVDAGATLTYSAQLNGGGGLPAWLSFDPVTRTFSGTPANSDVGTLTIDVTADDGNGGTVTDTFTITVANVNDAPTVANIIPNQNATEDAAFNFQFASNTFADA